MQTRTTALPEAPRTGIEVDAVRLDDVSKTFAAQRRSAAPVAALEGISLRAAPGEIVAVVGPSGCGKTTLLELVCGLIEPSGGTVDAQPAALMAQRDLLLPWAEAVDNAALALRVGGIDRAQARSQAGALLEDFGLGGFLRRDRTSCRAGCASASRSRARCSPDGRCCASTSRSRRSTR